MDRFAEARERADAAIGKPEKTWHCQRAGCFRNVVPLGPYYSGSELHFAVSTHLLYRHS